MKTRRALLQGGLTLLAARYAGAAATEPTAPPTTEILPDGATLVTLPEPNAPGVVWDVFFRVGQGDEGPYHGIRSLLTRCWIGQTEWRSAPLLAGDLARVGASVGTACGPDWTEVWGASGPDSYDVEKAAQTLFTNIIAGANFPRVAVEAARDEQIRALALRRDDLLFDVMDHAQGRAFGESPYALTPLGTEATVAAIPWAQAEKFYRRWFRPERAVIVAAGRITPDEARRRTMASLGAAGWDEGSSVTHTPVAAPPEKPVSPVAALPEGLRDLRLSRRSPAGCVALAYLAPGLSGASGRGSYAALLVLDAILRGGKATRLFALRDRPDYGVAPIGYEIRTVLLPGRGQSLWAVYVMGDRPAGEVRDRLRAALSALADGTQPLTDAEVARARVYLSARHGEARQRLRDRAFGVGWAETMGLGATFDTDYPFRLEAVTTEEVAHLAQKVLGANPAVVYSQSDI